MNLILLGAFVVLGVHMVSTLEWNEGCMADNNCRFEECLKRSNCPVNIGDDIVYLMWRDSWFTCHTNNWKKRDEEATGTFTFGNGRFSYLRHTYCNFPCVYQPGDEKTTKREFCYLTLAGAREFGITLDEGPEYNNIGVKSCYRKKSGGKKYTEGVNPWCGKSGLCCRFKQIKDQQSGCGNFDGDKEGKGDPSKNYHHCVKP